MMCCSVYMTLYVMIERDYFKVVKGNDT
uniref:Uncharacterized protein n=1 Tax=Anguilla anguilla TaxID=7936 RepID=A0A0E9TNG5_ANGAN